MLEAQLVAPCRHPEIGLLNRALVRHNPTCENRSGKGEKAYGQCERNACGFGHRCTPSIRQLTKTDIRLCLRVKCEGPHTSHRCHLKLTSEIGFPLTACRVPLPRLVALGDAPASVSRAQRNRWDEREFART